jgi:TonB-linked SusC/RagA family outer membrane protein
MKKILLSFLWVLTMIGSEAYAQNHTITGTVIGKDDGLPLPGVSVIVKGTKIGTQTNADGKYSISVPTGNQSLVFSFVGYGAVTAPANGGRLNISLIATANALNEVVVVGYGTQERRDITGSVGKVSGADIANLPAASFDKELAGRVTGVRVTESSGVLGAAPVIRVRGDNSLTSGTGPLYVVDGIPVITGNQGTGSNPQNPLGDINSEDIQSIEVLKDGASSAIYGSRAAGGVVLITTKKGKAGKTAVNYNMWLGSTSTSKRLDVLNAAQFIDISNEKFRNSGITAPQAFPTLDPSGNPYDTNWQDVVFRRGFQQNHALSVSGGTDNSSYYVSTGYSDFTGQIVGNDQRKYNVRANFEQKALNKILTFGITSGVSYQQNNGLNAGTNSLSGNVTNALLVFPNVPVFNADGSYNISADGSATQLGTKLGQGANLRQIDNNYTNIKYVLDNNVYRAQNLAFTGTGYVDAKIISGLNIRSQIGVNSLYGEDYNYLNNQHGDGRSANGSASQYFIPSFNYDWVNTLSYNKTFGDHKIQVVGGTEFQKFRYRYTQSVGSNISNSYFGPNTIISNTYVTQNIYGDITENSLRSFFGRANYSFKDRYLVGLTYRTDYISNLGINSKPANLPGASLGWRLSQESFFKESKALSFVNDLKIRASYAKTGNSNLSAYPFTSTYAPVNYGTQSAFAFTTLGNPDLKYETVKKTDIGFDLSMFNSRVTFNADYYKNNDDNLILQVPIAPSLGVPGNTINANVGSMYNKGWEFGITTQNFVKKDFSWTTGLNISFNKNRVTALNQGQDILSTYNVTRVGYSKSSFYGYQYEGVNAANGNPIYKKANGQLIQGNIANTTYYLYDPTNPGALSTQSSLSATDKVILGNSNPTYFGGLSNTFTYKGFDAQVYFTFSGGNKVYNATRQEDLDTYAFNNNGTEILQRWTTPGQITSVPKLYYGTAAGTFANVTGNTISRYLENGRFIRAQELTLGYTLPKTLINKLALSRVRIYGQVQNAFVITGYKGLDPEISNVTTATGNGVDFNANPRARTFIVGLNVGF